MPRSYTEPSRATGRRSSLDRILSLDDFEPRAKRYLPTPIFGYFAGAAEQNWSLAQNRASFSDYAFLPRVMRDVAQRSLETEILGKKWAAPFGIAPMGIAAIAGYRADVTMARAAAAAGIPSVLSGSSLIRLEEVVEAAPDSWFQIYLPGDTEQIERLLERVAGAGYRTLVITVDVPVMGNRENLIRAGFSTPLRPSLRLALQGVTRPRWLSGTFLRTLMLHGMPHFENSFAHRGAPIIARNVLRDFSGREHLNWSHIAHIRRIWDGKLIVKGILSPADAAIARDTGADAIVLSNHGARQLDGAVAPLRVLPDVVRAVPDLPVMLDSGVRRGSDVIKALALGARFVFVGRPFLYAAAIGGEAGVTHAIEILSSEIDRNLALLGLTSIEDLSEEVLIHSAGSTPARGDTQAG